jgi:hypothetical protein
VFLTNEISCCLAGKSPENRTWRQEAGGGEDGGGRRRLNIGGKSFLVDEDGNEVEGGQQAGFFKIFRIFDNLIYFKNHSYKNYRYIVP